MQKETEFVRIIKENEGVIFKITTLYTDNRDDQKDLYQDVVYQLWKSFDSFKGNAKIGTWIYRVALNTALTYSKKNKRKIKTVPIDFSKMELKDDTDDILDHKMKLMYAKIKELSKMEKSIIFLYLEGKDYTEISSITGFSTSNVGTRLNRIKNKLKSKI